MVTDDLIERLRQLAGNTGKMTWVGDLPKPAPAVLHRAADRIEALEAGLREVFEEWAGSEGFIPETAPEAYLLQLTKRMADIARAALEGTSHE